MSQPERVSASLRQELNLGEGEPFVNGETCWGTAYPIVGSENDFSEIEIIGRYPPEQGTYATNHGSREEVEIEEGEGWLYRLSNAGFLSLEKLKPGTKVVIEPGQHFAWFSRSSTTPQAEPEIPEIPEGASLDEVIAQALDKPSVRQATGMKLAMLCIPAFNPEQYIPSRTEDEILQSRAKEGEK